MAPYDPQPLYHLRTRPLGVSVFDVLQQDAMRFYSTLGNFAGRVARVRGQQNMPQCLELRHKCTIVGGLDNSQMKPHGYIGKADRLVKQPAQLF